MWELALWYSRLSHYLHGSHLGSLGQVPTAPCLIQLQVNTPENAVDMAHDVSHPRGQPGWALGSLFQPEPRSGYVVICGENHPLSVTLPFK